MSCASLFGMLEHREFSGFDWWMHRAAHTPTHLSLSVKAHRGRLLGERSRGRGREAGVGKCEGAVPLRSRVTCSSANGRSRKKSGLGKCSRFVRIERCWGCRIEQRDIEGWQGWVGLDWERGRVMFLLYTWKLG